MILTKRTENGAGRPNIRSAEPRKTAPLTIVPIKLMEHTNIFFVFPDFNNDAKIWIIINTKTAERSLSMTEGSWPPGKPVVRAAIIPATNPVTIVFLILGLMIMEIEEGGSPNGELDSFTQSLEELLN